MRTRIWMSALLVLSIGCAGARPGGAGNTGVIESIGHLDRGASVGVAGVLASGALNTPSGTTPARGAATVASAMAAPPPAAASAAAPGYRVSVRLDSGTLKTVDQADVASLRVGQRVSIENDTVVPR
jgi:hypothetical protein